MFVVTIIKNGELEDCHLTETLKQAQSVVRYYIRKDGIKKIDPQKYNILKQKEIKTENYTMNIIFFPGPKTERRMGVYYNNKFYTIKDYIAKVLKRTPRRIQGKAQSRGMTLIEYLYYINLMPEQIEKRKEELGIISPNSSAYLRFLQKYGNKFVFPTETNKENQTLPLPKIEVSESDLKDKYTPYKDYEL